VRLFLDPSTGFVLTGQYIQQPDNITGGATSFASFDTSGMPPNPNRVFLNGFDVTGGQGATQAYWPIQVGDYIQIQGGQAHQIALVDNTTTPNSVVTAVPVWNPALGAPGPTTNFTIIRQPRPIPGEPFLQFPDDVGINLNLSLADSTPLSALGTTSFDIVFSPSGTLTGALGNGFSKIIFWVQDYTQDLDQPGEMPLICVFCRTGRTGGFQNNYQNGMANAYFYVYDPRATGL
jgi:hypothetical protein